MATRLYLVDETTLRQHAVWRQWVERWIWILWPSFLVAIVAEGVFFSLFDPVEVTILNIHIPPDRSAAYTIGFFAFWLMGAASSACTCWLQRKPPARLPAGETPVSSPG